MNWSRVKHLFKGTAEAFTAVNLILFLTSSLFYQEVIYIGLLFRPQVLTVTVPLSLLFHLNVKYLRRWMDSEDMEILEDADEVTPDLD